MSLTPFEEIKKLLSEIISPKYIDFLPDKWEKIGDVVIVKLSDDVSKYREEIGKKYADVLGCKTVLNDKCGITGVYRKPNVEVIYGSNETETILKENGIRYKLDPQKVMFSSGNMNERIRMASVSNKDEIVVDLFAGIGYFTLPMAVYSKPKKIFACEINPVSHSYLCDNIVLNDSTEIVEPLLGDNRNTAPEDVADRIIMGYFEEIHEFLPVAFNCLKKSGGVIHYHEVCPNKLLPGRPLDRIKDEANKHGKDVDLLHYNIVKSYAPGVSHAVLDVKIG